MKNKNEVYENISDDQKKIIYRNIHRALDNLDTVYEEIMQERKLDEDKRNSNKRQK